MTDLTQRLAGLSPAKRQLLEQKLRQNSNIAEPIAVVGMSCRLPGAKNLQEYWRLIAEGIEAVGEIPASRWNADEFYDSDYDAVGKMATRWGGFVADVDQFDPLFFGIAPREASKIDPQQRLLLEVGWETMEHACAAPDRMAGSKTGVYLGIGGTDYSKLPMEYENYLQYIDAHAGTGNALSIAANRMSYIFDLRGPSVAVDTACSSGLVAIHLAMQALRNRECDAALAGAVNLILTPEVTIAFSKARMLSADGHCRPFDAGANGYVRGEGAAMLLFKRLTDAVAAGDNIWAVVRGSAVNQDGKTSGITAPSSVAQQAVIQAALANAGMNVDRVSYLEAHGTGTPLGDPIEMESLTALFRRKSEEQSPCYVTSVKANIGHTETVSGVAGLIKVALMMRHGVVPAQTNLREVNPHINLAGTRLVIPRQTTPWIGGNSTRVAGVSSFGFGGTNAHIVVEEAAASKVKVNRSDRPLHVLPLSAKSKTALMTLAGNYADYLQARPEDSLADICFTAAAGRSHLAHRLVAIAETREQLQGQLQAFVEGRSLPGLRSGQASITSRPSVAFLFTGQGSQYVGMGQALYDSQPVFRQTIDECNELLRDELRQPLVDVLYPQPREDSPLDQTAYTQPALFAIEYALAQLWRSWGVEPTIVMGHSVGEYVAACLAGVFSLTDAVKLIARRARLMQALPHDGLMAVVFAPADRVNEAISPHRDCVAIAAANGPENTVISGNAEAIRALLEQFASQKIGTQLLTVSHAFHSPLMEPMLDEFELAANDVEFSKPKIELISNLTGEVSNGPAPTANYWRLHIRNTVQFAGSLQTLAKAGPQAVIEIGPTASLIGMGKRCCPELQTAWLPSLRKGQEDWRSLLDSLAQLYLTGARIDWAGFDQPWTRRRLELPTYPFERTRTWFEPASERRSFGAESSGPRGKSVHPLLGSEMPTALETTLFECRLSTNSPKYLIDHQVQGSPVTPGAVYLEQALAAATQLFGPGAHAVENVAIGQAMFLQEGASRSVQVTIAPEHAGTRSFEVYSVPVNAEGQRAEWLMHANGTLRHAESLAESRPQPIEFEQLFDKELTDNRTEISYELMASRGLAYGPTFQVLGGMQFGDGAVLADVRLPEAVSKELDKYHLHPALLDGGLQCLAGVIPLEADGSYSPFTYMPTGVRRLRMFGRPEGRMKFYVVRTSADNRPSPEFVEADILLVAESGEVLAELCGVRVQRLGRAASKDDAGDVRSWLYRIEWQAESLPALPAEQTPAKSNGNGHHHGNGHLPSQALRTWLIFADPSGVGLELAAQLRSSGRRCVLIAPGEEFKAADAERLGQRDCFWIDPLNPEHYRRLLAEALPQEQPACEGIVHLWSLGIPDFSAGKANAGQGAIVQSRRLGCGSALQLLQQSARAKFAKSPSLWLITRGAQSVSANDNQIAAAQSPLWGLGRVAAFEHPELRCRLVDLDPVANVNDQVTLLACELGANAAEDQIAYRSGERRVARLQPRPEVIAEENKAVVSGELSIPAEGPFRLRLGTAGSFDALRMESCQRIAPASNQVEIEVHAAGLNFSDVLKALGLYPGITDVVVPLGIECSGRVTAIGDQVTRFKVGDEVMGVAPFSFATHALTADYAIVPKPPGISHEDAAGLPIAYLTAYYGLIRLSDLQPGEKVLIHAGAGGVGLAAIQIAQHAGAEIFATAGSDTKRDYLRSLGVQHVLNSRGVEFADEIMKITQRRGVDVVLNSLPGEAIPKSLSILSAYGRFLEIGKIDIYQNRMIGLSPFQDNLSYFAIDLDRMLRQKPEYIRKLFAEVMEHFTAGHYQPLAITQFAAADTAGAFRYMAQRKNIGKVVVSLTDRPIRDGSTNDGEAAPAKIRANATYLITGGLGALGLQLANWLVEQGARKIVLLARRGPNEAATSAIEALRGSGAEVAVIQGDVADRDSLAKALASIPREYPPLVGVFHAAGVLDDGMLFDMDMARFDKPLGPKLNGAWNLHAVTEDAPLELFVMFSSVACVLGSPGQGNYAAANAFLDGLAAYRRSIGKPALSINWGPWADAGMAADPNKSELLAARGMNLLPAQQAWQVFGELLKADPVNAAVMSVRWGQMLRQISGGVPPLLREVAPRDGEAAAGGNSEDVALRQRLSTLPLPEREQELREFFSQQLAKIMGLEASQIDASQPLNTLGLDSLMAIELKNNIETRLKVVLPMARFMEGPSVNSLAGHVAADMGEQQQAVTEIATAAESRERQPLSLGQKALWFLNRLAPNSAAYNIFDAVRARGPLNLENLRKSIEALVSRHAVFRTTFHDENGEPYQQIHESLELGFRVVEAADLPPDEVQRQLAGVCCQPFDLEHGPLVRIVVFRFGPEEFLLSFVVHHIVADFWTIVSCVQEFSLLYTALQNGQQANLPPLRLSYADFIRWQDQLLTGEAGEKHWQYWRERLAGELPVLNLPTDKPRPNVQAYNGGLAFRRLSADQSVKLRQLGEQHGVTMNVLLLAAYQALLSRYCGQDEVLVGVPTTGRTRSEFASLAGYFVNPVVIRGDLAANPTFADFVAQIRDRMHEALDHQDYPFPLLVEKIAPHREAGRTPLFQTMFAMQKAQSLHEEGLTAFLTGQAGAQLDVGGVTYESVTLDQWTAQFDLTMIGSEANGCLALALQFNTDLFERATGERLLAGFETLLDSIVAEPATPIGELNLLPAAERQQVVADWNATEKAWDSQLLVHQAIERQAEATPAAVAVSGAGESLTYIELNARANQLSHRLRELKVGPGTRMGICLARCPDLLVAILGVLKAGGAYVPLDPAYPQGRLSDIVEGAGLSVVITHEAHRSRLPASCQNLVLLDAERENLAARPQKNPAAIAKPDDLIYVIFTSGSTGKPKGAGVYHRGFANLVQWWKAACKVQPGDCSLVFTSHGFDLMQKNLLGTLAAGGRLHLYSGTVYDPAQVSREIHESKASVLICTPSGFYPLLGDGDRARYEQLASLRCVQLAGEPMEVSQMVDWLQNPLCRAELQNAYGPTECTDIVAWERLVDPLSYVGRRVPIGRPIENSRVYVVDARLTPVPVGVAGEICVGGVPVGAGYVNDPQLTATKFVADPFNGEAGARLYRTGDLGRFLPDGRIEYLGRADQQVKIRGFRIELGEIEAALREHAAVRDCVVVARGEQTNQQLVAYVVPQSPGEPLDAKALADQVRSRLPDYMVPTAIVSLEALPLTPHGKLDRRALPAPEGSFMARGAKVAPRTELERQLVAIWEEMLRVRPIGVTDGFFDLGGHSLLAVQLASRIQRELGKTLPLATIFEYHTVERLAQALEAKTPTAASKLPLVEIQPRGSRPKLFCVHPTGGQVLSYFGLAAELGEDQPVFGLQARGLAGDGPVQRTMDELVTEYATAIRRAAGSETIYLCGWSFGGLVAYEVAGKLRELGSNVAAVIMLDTVKSGTIAFDPNDEVEVVAETADFVARLTGAALVLTREELRGLDQTARLELLRVRGIEAGALPPEFTSEQVKATFEVTQANLRVQFGHLAKVNNVPVHLVRAKETAKLGDDLGWKALLGEHLTTHVAPGDHVTFLQGENVVKVAEIVKLIVQ